ncbi:MAG: HupE/UreJ family protein [Gammaproteobacteria bacterium]|nr:HupE/UreJ family protein [Gammaproteobacteria bacterium]
MTRLIRIGLLFGTCLLGSPLLADEFQPLTVRITQTAGSTDNGYLYSVETRIPNDQRIAVAPRAQIAEFCQSISEQITQLPDRSFRRAEAYRCDQSLQGTTVQLDFGGRNPGLTSLIAVELGPQHRASIALPPLQASWQIPDQPNTTEVATQYAGLGFKHLLTGYDHLLFVGCLLFICLGRWKHLILTITSFTVAHSLSLALNAFGLVYLHVRAVEAIIALSIVYLASDIVRHTLARGNYQPSLSYRYPATVAGGFGLLHGLGFANILNEFGLPQADRLVALFSFNVGIEIGQLVFIGAVIGLGWMLMRAISWLNTPQAQRSTALVTSYLIGSIAMFWTVERIANTI